MLSPDLEDGEYQKAWTDKFFETYEKEMAEQIETYKEEKEEMKEEERSGLFGSPGPAPPASWINGVECSDYGDCRRLPRSRRR